MSSILRLVLWPAAAITWAVILLRLGGELVEGPSWLFSRRQGGGLALVGIAWLVVVFGAWFGWRLAREGRGPDRPVQALLLHAVALAMGIGGMVGLGAAGAIDTGDPGPGAACYIGAVLFTSSLLMLWSWRELFLANLLYGVLGRLGVILVTIPATLSGWDTHFSKLGPKGYEEASWAQVMKLSTAQVCFWIPFTILVGGLFGSIAAMFAGRRREDSVQPDQAGAAGVVGGGDV